jgi:uncharacterized membrane protein YqjE
MTQSYDKTGSLAEGSALPVDAAESTSSTRGEAPVEEQSLGSILSRISSDVSTLVRKELDLAKLELRDEGKKAGKTAGMFGGAALAGWMAALFLSLTIMWALDNVMDVTWAALIVFALWAIAAAVLAANGRQQAKAINAVPEQTVATIKEDAQWLKAQKK